MNWLLLMLLSSGETALMQFAREQLVKDPVLTKGIIATVYVWIDGAVENLVKTTPATWDNDAVDRVKRVCQNLATEAGFTLSNIDAGTPND